MRIFLLAFCNLLFLGMVNQASAAKIHSGHYVESGSFDSYLRGKTYPGFVNKCTYTADSKPCAIYTCVQRIDGKPALCCGRNSTNNCSEMGETNKAARNWLFGLCKQDAYKNRDFCKTAIRESKANINAITPYCRRVLRGNRVPVRVGDTTRMGFTGLQKACNSAMNSARSTAFHLKGFKVPDKAPIEIAGGESCDELEARMAKKYRTRSGTEPPKNNAFWAKMTNMVKSACGLSAEEARDRMGVCNKALPAATSRRSVTGPKRYNRGTAGFDTCVNAAVKGVLEGLQAKQRAIDEELLPLARRGWSSLNQVERRKLLSYRNKARELGTDIKDYLSSRSSALALEISTHQSSPEATEVYKRYQRLPHCEMTRTVSRAGATGLWEEPAEMSSGSLRGLSGRSSFSNDMTNDILVHTGLRPDQFVKTFCKNSLNADIESAVRSTLRGTAYLPKNDAGNRVGEVMEMMVEQTKHSRRLLSACLSCGAGKKDCLADISTPDPKCGQYTHDGAKIFDGLKKATRRDPVLLRNKATNSCMMVENQRSENLPIVKGKNPDGSFIYDTKPDGSLKYEKQVVLTWQREIDGRRRSGQTDPILRRVIPNRYEVTYYDCSERKGTGTIIHCERGEDCEEVTGKARSID